MRIQAVEAINDKKIAFILPAGELDDKEFEKMDQKFQEMIQQGDLNIILDLSRVEHVNYKIVGSLIEYQQKFKELGGDIKLVNVSPYIYDILRLYGFYPFEIFPSKRAALKSFM